ncbi:hypothetical protein, conserved [Babesia bigemina]|uniref:Methyltransferase domain-containing protein n=1 Tax=Babesia bigemina TaxID=5866 RepID=A0A061DBW5_BABBI|nr:hypothetical protein, conserved [Babesia bigemina]CDR95245.1 hypothetical protein, conserved [Babesia bigemina]|eukprot:XP_012767431.1 hypothetical protein, conserved [Babesia bigemina]
MPAQYSTVEYWNKRYEEIDGTYDWYMDWHALKAHLPVEVNADSRILHVGCGTSKLAQDLHEAGIHDVKNVDISASCINAMREMFPHLAYAVVDAAQIGSYYPAESFDLVIDKGCLDTMLCNKNFDETVPAMLKGIHTVLRPVMYCRNNGTLVVVSVGCPDNRMMYFEPSGLWKIRVVKVPKRHMEYLEEASPTAALPSFGTFPPAHIEILSGEVSGAPLVETDTAPASSSMSEERSNHFIYVCRKVL